MSWLTGDDDDEHPYADYEARGRPNPKGNRARTKIRPEHKDAVTGRVLTVDRGRYSVLIGEGTGAEHEATTTRASELRKQAIVTGDRVDLVGDTTGDEGSLSRIVRIQERSTLLRRSADDSDEVERIIVANADQMLIVVAAANPEPRPRLVDRYLVAAFDAGIAPILCITKTDLADPGPFLDNFAGLDITVVTSAEGEWPLERLRELLSGHSTVAVGHSGVGKSTLVNALVPDANRAIGRVNTVTGRGRHTSSSSISVPGGRRLDHRHPRRAELRARARGPRQHPAVVHRPRRARAGLPARMHAPAGLPRLRHHRRRRGRQAGRQRKASAGLVPPPAHHARRLIARLRSRRAPEVSLRRSDRRACPIR